MKNRRIILEIALLLFLLATVAWGIYGDYIKAIAVYWDEMYIYGYAENLSQGRDLAIVYRQSWSEIHRYGYSYLLSFAFKAANRYDQFRYISFMNSAICASGVFPTMLIASKVLKDNKHIAIAGILYILSIDMAYSLSFMADPLLSALVLWMIFFAVKIIKNEQIIISVVGFFAFFALSVLTKRSALLFGSVALFTIALFKFSQLFVRREKGEDISRNRKILKVLTILIAIVLSGFLIYAMYKIIIKLSFDEMAVTYINNMFLTEMDFKVFLKGFAYCYIHLIIAALIFPVLIPIAFYRHLDKYGKYIFWFAIISTIPLSAVQARHMMQVAETIELRFVSLRYSAALFPLFNILMLQVYESIQPKKKISWLPLKLILFIIGLVAVVLPYTGTIVRSPVDQILLRYVNLFMDDKLLTLKVILAAFSVIGVVLLVWKKQAFLVCFIFVYMVTQVLNFKDVNDNFVTLYRVDDNTYAEVKAVEDFIEAHGNETFLVMHTNDDTGNYQNIFNRFSDSFLNKANVYYSDINIIKGNKPNLDNGYTLPNERLVKTDNINYVVMPKLNKAVISEEYCELVDFSNAFYSIYRLYDSRILPLIYE